MLTKKERRWKHKAVEQTQRYRIAHLRNIAQLYGSMTEFSRLLGKDAAFLSAIIGPNPTRSIGENLARSLEESLQLEMGFLDTPCALT